MIKSFKPKSMPILFSVFGVAVCVVSTRIETKYSFVGVLEIVHCLIIPEKVLCRIISIGFLNFGILNLLFSILTDCGIVN